MNKWVLLFAVAACMAAVGGFVEGRGIAAGLGQMLFFICLVGFMVSLVLSLTRKALR
jgi:uncharacterized membrane protein YtjA (UPF0391 family)